MIATTANGFIEFKRSLKEKMQSDIVGSLGSRCSRRSAEKVISQLKIALEDFATVDHKARYVQGEGQAGRVRSELELDVAYGLDDDD